MLKFTKEQWAAVCAEREAWNARSEARAEGLVQGLEGNSLAIPAEAWRRIDTRAQSVARSRLAVFDRLARASTTPVDIADLVSYYPQVSDEGDVLVTMDGRNAAKGDAPEVNYVGTPVPILTSTARIGWRQMAQVRRSPLSLDTTAVNNKQRRIAEKMEDMALNGLPGQVVNGQTIYGLRTLPQRNTFIHGLTLSTATGAQWVAAFKQAIFAAIGDNQFGRITIFLNFADYTTAGTTDYVNGSNVTQGTIMQRLRALEQLTDIVPASSVPANEILGVVDLEAGEWGTILSAMPLTTRPKTRLEPEDDYVFGVMAAVAPQFRYDFNGQSAFLHGTTA